MRPSPRRRTSWSLRSCEASKIQIPAAISVSDRTPASIVEMRPARLSRPLSIRNAELPAGHRVIRQWSGGHLAT